MWLPARMNKVFLFFFHFYYVCVCFCGISRVWQLWELPETSLKKAIIHFLSGNWGYSCEILQSWDITLQRHPQSHVSFLSVKVIAVARWVWLSDSVRCLLGESVDVTRLMLLHLFLKMTQMTVSQVCSSPRGLQNFTVSFNLPVFTRKMTTMVH